MFQKFFFIPLDGTDTEMYNTFNKHKRSRYFNYFFKYLSKYKTAVLNECFTIVNALSHFTLQGQMGSINNVLNETELLIISYNFNIFKLNSGQW